MNQEDTRELFIQAYWHQSHNKLPEAIQLYEALIRQDPTQAEAMHYLGLAYAQLGQVNSAIAWFLKAMALTPDSPALHNNLANAYKKKQQLDLAKTHYQQAIALSPEYAEAHHNLAGLYASEKNYQQALKEYSVALHKEPGFAAAHFNLGLLLLQMQEWAAAETQFNNVLALHEEHIESLFYLGVLALQNDELAKAEKQFERVLELNNQHVEALCNLGIIALKRQEGQLAISWFSKSLALDNNHLESLNNLASTFMHYDRFENALMHYDVLLKKDPNNIEYLYNSGVAQMALGHLEEAIAHFEHLLTLQENHFAALSNLAAIYIRLEKRSKAKELLELALLANPDDTVSRHMLNALSGITTGVDTSPLYAKNLFDNYATYYDEHLKKQLHYTLPNQILSLISELNITHSENTLDLGAGTGLTGQVLRDISKHLLGVDISEKMLNQAREKGVYDELVQSELVLFLEHSTKQYDLIVAADVLPYLGELDSLFKAIKKNLSPQGYFIFSTEISQNGLWVLQQNSRFAHHPDYLNHLAQTHDLLVEKERTLIARWEDKKPVSEMIVALTLPKHPNVP